MPMIAPRVSSAVLGCPYASGSAMVQSSLAGPAGSASFAACISNAPR